MKKLAVILGVLALGATMAFAYGPGMGSGYHNGMMGYQGGMMGYQGGMMGYQGQPYGGPGYHRGGPGYGRGMMPGYNCPGPFYGNQQVNQLTEKEATKKVEEFLSVNLKGFEIVNQEQFNMPRGTMYQYTVQDENKNNFLIRVNPFGYVVGPMPIYNNNQ
ncbi:PepSY domain-containing protein [Flexistipes sp.]|uniref:PepSY domain-containing protein n=1 Tax=Flexistipes sp. TaxID=3088135 RepID=UPI002E1DCE68|nr:PepSY domain-containing protein [Flexistipes sp.]